MKRIYNTSIITMLITTTFWVLYTVVFLFIDGWHWKPVSIGELVCSLIAQTGWRFGTMLWIYIVVCIVNAAMDGWSKGEEDSKLKNDIL